MSGWTTLEKSDEDTKKKWMTYFLTTINYIQISKKFKQSYPRLYFKAGKTASKPFVASKRRPKRFTVQISGHNWLFELSVQGC